ncbi:DUF3192 domain-containing protein [Shewanella intestini]|uniref:DUF3192 domain-containing protein n=1 Tax=Shewanella intestini TaxID=2017544 RepID=A0ABS5HYB5_9GAMM|nr:DUF3192 domain-containing protein [Shewanella sp. XMDDZSB0408]MBR9726773.1 DUF3192 domain-containing protein [Shewanella intestini]MRG34661.1 DUF3192 domain-containing protein [Shewanella sp. XMDDZSB0408]
MNNKAPIVIGSVFVGYLIFVAITMTLHTPTPDDQGWEDRQQYNQQKIAELTLGLSLKQVSTLLGSADFVEAKNTATGAFQLRYYRTHHIASDNKTTKDECTPLLFNNQKLIAWGEQTIEQFLQTPLVSAL